MSVLISIVDKSSKEEETRGKTKEDQKLEVVKSWMEVGASNAG